jgi:hypothetical protein
MSMETLRSEVIKHMLEAAHARRLSPVFALSDHWHRFNRWCETSSHATRIISHESEGIESFCLDRENQLYCVAMSLETLESVTKHLIETYEDEVLERLFT